MEEQEIQEQGSEPGSFPPDFAQIMRTRLEEIPNFQSKDTIYDDRFGLSQIGIKGMLKYAWALAFIPYEGNDFDWTWEIWIENPRFIYDERYPHWEVEDKLELYLGVFDKKIKLQKSAMIFVDTDQKIHMLFDRITERGIREDIQSKYGSYYERWASLIERYNLSSMIGLFSEHRSLFGSSFDGQPQTLVNVDIIGQLRENEYIYSFAEEHNLTITQWLRFRMLAKAYAGKVGYNKIIADILAQEQEDS